MASKEVICCFTLTDLHFGHLIFLFSYSDIDIISEKRFLHFSHLYSYVGMVHLLVLFRERALLDLRKKPSAFGFQQGAFKSGCWLIAEDSMRETFFFPDEVQLVILPFNHGLNFLPVLYLFKGMGFAVPRLIENNRRYIGFIQEKACFKPIFDKILDPAL